jgi:hypothetical protein
LEKKAAASISGKEQLIEVMASTSLFVVAAEHCDR